MKLHIFNPEHDIALAADVRRFTAPLAARQLRRDLAFLPALWADDGDFVLVEEVDEAVRQSKFFGTLMADVRFVSADDLRRLSQQFSAVEIEPWGWDFGVVETLSKAGLGRFCPSAEQIRTIRELSSRRWAAEHLLPALRSRLSFKTVGVSRYISHESELPTAAEIPFVLKSPWSSSGRGIRYVFDPKQLERNLSWARRVVGQQGGIMVEPFYEKVTDFAMEFEADGAVVFKGLSLFLTKNGAYTGNLIASEREKQEILSEWVPVEIQTRLSEAICSIVSEKFSGRYTGPFGIDMMIVRDGSKNLADDSKKIADGSKNRGEKSEIALHPCVELNLRRTMGHVALSIPCEKFSPKIMSIDNTDRHRLQIIRSNEKFVNSSSF